MSKHPKRKMLFSVYESPQLREERWEQFKATARANGDTWLAVLVRAIDRYMAEKEQPPS